jgi:FlaA1/EpsC-like NDP-sugar epimerase
MFSFVYSPSRNKRSLIVAAIYTVLLSMAFWAAWEVRYDFAVPEGLIKVRLLTLIPFVAMQVAMLVIFRQFGSMLTYFGLPDLLRVLGAQLASSSIAFIWWGICRQEPDLIWVVPRSVMMTDFILSMGFVGGFRVALRIYRERITLHQSIGSHRARKRIAIVGAGDVGASLASECLNRPARGLLPVVFLDDDEAKHGGLVHGIPVAGRVDEVTRLRERFEFEHVIIAMPTAPEKRIREVIKLMTEKGLGVEIVPSVDDLVSGRAKVTRIRSVEVEDLLGREQVVLDTAGIAHMVAEKVVLVTGAGGSIGSELCRQIAACNPSRLLLLEQSEAALFVIEQELIARGMGAIIQPVIADIVDRARIVQIFERYKPSLIFHAAAHKHVYLMERQPAEALKNNSLGTLLLAEEAVAHGVEIFLAISTDKAINPTNIMGASKRLAELMLQGIHASGRSGTTRLMAVRFGNVLGSSGSVVPIFKQQIANGGPVTVTHPDVTRYFMTIPEAVGLVLQTALLSKGGEVFVLDMGQPVKIADLARQMIQLSGFSPDTDIEITYVGLKPGEKLYEELQHSTETHQPTAHPRILRFVANGIDPDAVRRDLLLLRDKLNGMEINEVKLAVQKLLPEYTPYLD